LGRQGRIEKKDFSFLQWTQTDDGKLWDRIYYICKMRKSILSFESLGDRRCKLGIQGKFRNISFISTHAPTEDSPDAIKYAFYDIKSRL
jgi:hypothetical protein